MRMEASSDAKHRPRVLLIYPTTLIPSIRLCGHCQMEWLAEQGKAEYRHIQAMKLRAADLNWADVVLLGRLDSWYEHRLVKLLKGAGKYLVYIIDDDLLNISPELSSAAYYGQAEIQDCILGMMAMSDCIISPSPLLLEKYAAGKRAIQIEEPAINPVAYAPHDPDNPVKIGFAGSIDRTQDIERILKQALTAIKRDYGDRVTFEFFGAIPDFAGELGAACIPYTDSYDRYRDQLNRLQWDIGLAPMPDTPFHACKHYNKFSEYAAAGIAGVFSEVYPYTRIREFPECYVLCGNTPERWEGALKRLIEDSGTREDYRRQAVQCAREWLGVPQSATALEQGLLTLPFQKSSTVLKDGQLQWLKICGLQKRLFAKIRYSGVSGAVKAVFRKLGALVID